MENTPVHHVNEARRSLCCCTWRSHLVVGGIDGKKTLSSVEFFHLASGTWKSVPDMGTARCDFAMAVVGLKAYVFGGMGTNTAEVFDLETNRWAAMPPVPTDQRKCSTAVAIGNCILVFGDGLVDCFDISTGTWCCLSALRTKRRFCAALIVGGHVMAVGGCHGQDHLDSAKFLALDDLWALGVLPVPTDVDPQQRKEALKEWVKKVDGARKEFLATVETEIGKLNREFSVKKAA
mmetsp:Transcript_25727/g.59752  ORF Transcript_25727/g.59752 Transcript_25727/m.59752 type:complete len:235 (+) Transcript_25727:215-919(+)